MAIKCPKCHADNPETKQFCADCGTRLSAASDIRPEVTETFQTPVRELTTGSTFAGRYRVIEELGHGGMGKVYRVLDQKLDEEVALKLIRPEIAADKETIKRFHNELRLARKIAHRNVGKMYELMEEAGAHFITMEYVPGQDLKGLIRQMGQLTAGKAVLIAKQVCEGLEEAHRQGVVHRDLKPGNILIDRDGNARIMDFGIARSLSGKGLTGAGVMIGTPEYMSPEQIEGGDVDQRSDVYSLGTVLYEMLTGRVPFEGDTPFTIGVKHKIEMPRDPRGLNAQIPADLGRLVLKCLEKDKARRPQSAGELYADLERVEQGLPTTERVVSKRKPLTSREVTVKFDLRKLVLPLLGMIGLIATGVAVWKFVPHRKVPPAPKIERSIAVISFKNETGDPAYDYLQKAIPNLLITNLENTGLFYVATWERMQDILKQMGVKSGPVIDSDLGFELCRREGIKALAIGSFTKAGDVFLTDVKVLDVETKRILKSANIKGKGVDSILDSQIDALSRDMSLGLGVEPAEIEAVPLQVRDITTPSLQAYDYFLKGKTAYNLVDWPEAKKNLAKALEIDPAFAMAYVYLAWANHNTGDIKVRNETIKKAMALINKASQKDRLYLEAGHALFVEQDLGKHGALLEELVSKYPDEKWAFHYLGDYFMMYREDYAAAVGQYEKWYRLDPQDPNAMSHITGASYLMGDFRKASEYVKRHDAVAPPDPYNLTLQGMLHALMGQFDRADAKFHEALGIQADFSYTLLWLTMTYAVREKLEESLKWAGEYVSRASSPGLRSEAYCRRGWLLAWSGRFREALADFDQAEKLAEEVENWMNKALALEGRGSVLLSLGAFDRSRASFESELEVFTGRLPAWYLPFSRAFLAWRFGLLAVEQRRFDLAKSEISEIEATSAEVEGKDKDRLEVLRDLVQGEALLAQGDLEGALAAAQRACGPGSPYWDWGFRYWGWFNEYASYYMDLAARVLAEKGDIAQAIAEYERLLRVPFTYRSVHFVHPLHHYRLGVLFERAGEAAKAKGQYARFLELWKGADAGLPEVADARKRLAGFSSI